MAMKTVTILDNSTSLDATSGFCLFKVGDKHPSFIFSYKNTFYIVKETFLNAGYFLVAFLFCVHV